MRTGAAISCWIRTVWNRGDRDWQQVHQVKHDFWHFRKALFPIRADQWQKSKIRRFSRKVSSFAQGCGGQGGEEIVSQSAFGLFLRCHRPLSAAERFGKSLAENSRSVGENGILIHWISNLFDVFWKKQSRFLGGTTRHGRLSNKLWKSSREESNRFHAAKTGSPQGWRTVKNMISIKYHIYLKFYRFCQCPTGEKEICNMCMIFQWAWGDDGRLASSNSRIAL